MDSLIFLFFVSGLLTTLAFDPKSLPGFGEKCTDDKNHPCDFKQRLRCNSSKICECYLDYHYSDKAKNCIPNLGTVCNPPLDSDCPPHAFCQMHLAYRGVFLPKMILKSISYFPYKNENIGICRCDTGFMATSNTICSPALRHGDKCEPKTKPGDKVTCNIQQHQICCPETKTCRCKSKKTIYDPNLLMCVRSLGSNCTNSEDQCVADAVCSRFIPFLYKVTNNIPNFYDPLYPTYVKNMKELQAKNTCECLPGFTPTKDGKCLRSYNVECSKNEHCNEDAFLTCVNGLCRCALGAGAEFHLGTFSKCHLIPGTSCSKSEQRDGTSPPCNDGSECKNGRCEVIDPAKYHERPDFLLTFGNNCTTGSLKYKTICDPILGLACIEDKTCACFDSTYSWNSKKGKCVAKEGDRCGRISLSDGNIYVRYGLMYPTMDRNRFPSPDMPFHIDCDEGLSCVYQAMDYVSRCKKLK